MSKKDKFEKSDDIKKLEEEYDRQKALYNNQDKEEKEILTADSNGSLIKDGLEKIKDVKESIFLDILPF